jgi:hypothetical protein
MNKFQRNKFFKRIEAKYNLDQIVDPWKGQPEAAAPEYRVISQLEILQCVGNVPGVMLIPRTYQVEVPEGRVYEPWGPTITFTYGTSPVPKNLQQTGNLNIISQVENQIQSKFGMLIHSISTEYQGENNTGQSLYQVTITEKA